MTRLVYLDTETTGLDETVHVPWEVAAIVDDPDDKASSGEWVFRITPTPAELAHAQPEALVANRYHERPMPDMAVGILSAPRDWPGPDLPECWAWDDRESGLRVVVAAIADVLDGAVIVGSYPDFDKRSLGWLFRRHRREPTWDYHAYDIRAMVYAQMLARYQYLGEEFVPTPETKSADLFAAFGVSIDPAVAHTALGDARHVRAVWHDIHGRARRPLVWAGIHA